MRMAHTPLVLMLFLQHFNSGSVDILEKGYIILEDRDIERKYNMYVAKKFKIFTQRGGQEKISQ